MAKKTRIKAIIFDLGGVVVHGGYLDFLKHYCLECLTPLGKKQILKLEHEVNLGKISEAEFYQQLQTVFGVHLTAKKMHDLIVKKMRPNKALLRLLPRIKKSKIVMFTNSIGHIAAEVLRMGRHPIRPLFDRVFDSAKIHLAKPDLKSYRYLIKKLKIKPGEALLVDDRPENIRAAKKNGMNGIVYKNISQFRKTIREYGFR